MSRRGHADDDTDRNDDLRLQRIATVRNNGQRRKKVDVQNRERRMDVFFFKYKKCLLIVAYCFKDAIECICE